jgi:hypothetical protein
MKLPKAISCRLSDQEDKDIQEVLAKSDNRAQRVKELIRLGIQAEKNGVYSKDTEEKRVKCFNLATPRKPKLFV